MLAVSTTTVSVPLDHAWRVLADHPGMSDWGPITVTLEKPGTAEAGGVGAVRRIKAPGPAPAIVEEITAYEPNTRLAYKALAGVPFADYAGEVLLASNVQGGTTITWTLSARQRIRVVERLALKAVASGLVSAYVRHLNRTA